MEEKERESRVTPEGELPDLHPEAQGLLEQIPRLRAALTTVLLQKNDLILITCPQIETAYLRRFGALELKLYDTRCACLRAKRRVRLLRACRSRREEPDLAGIEATLDRELESYHRELEDRLCKVHETLEHRRVPGLTKKGAQELRELYLRSVKALHPDLHPEGDEAQGQALQQVMRAYKAKDLTTLRALCEGIAPRDREPPQGLEALRAEAERLQAGIRRANEEMEKIKGEFPYAMRVFLTDPEQERRREAALTEELRTYRTRLTDYEAQAARLEAGDLETG